MTRQQTRIYEYILRFGSITPMEAFADLGITKLATRVSEMKRQGIQFDQQLQTRGNRFGEKGSYMEYKLKSDPVSHTESQGSNQF